ncbi:MAG: fumarylacetoacetate hydrolase family protein [Candidatus Latescibacterota bacterium]|nr:fumarylacetoacetate hydrolase family protein [Candidatus Latescibacterota bacterium]MED5416203.1 fumarylacetoacetate hydrolase family protein [Candidatus Latescibacterota bacterium]
MRLIQFLDTTKASPRHLGVVDGDEILDLTQGDGPASLFELYYDRGGDRYGLDAALAATVTAASGNRTLSLTDLLAAPADSAIRLDKPVSGPDGKPYAMRVWLAGVTHEDSAKLREIEAQQATGDAVNVYDQKYRECAAGGRPELFSKGEPDTVVGHHGVITRPADTERLVPETELISVYALNAAGQIERLGYTGGNDATDNGIEATNPLNLPQAKNWAGGCASMGPSLITASAYDDADVTVSCEILRGGQQVGFKEGRTGQSNLNMPDGLLHMERMLFRRLPLEPRQLQVLYWGTPIVFAEADLADGLQVGDVVRMTFSGGIGTLDNEIEPLPETTQLGLLEG